MVRPATVTNQYGSWLLVVEDQNGGLVNSGGSKIYATLARLPLPKSYLGKIMLSAFLGTHVPFITLALYLLLFAASIDLRASLSVLVIALVAILLGTLVTLKVIHALEETSATDHLTGAYNRRAGEQWLTSDLSRVGRGEGTLSVAVVDLDRLKPLNDRYGHQAGDTCLRHLAHTCMRNIRKGDWLARWGGDEFVLALWEEEKGERKTAKENPVLNRIAMALAENPVRLSQGEMIRLSFSAGVVRCTSSEEAELGVGGVLALADEALYEAKEEGDQSTFVYAH
jgi:diguanylate cyclase (GGDEF)-like protein